MSAAGDVAFPQGVEHPQLFHDGPGGEGAAQGAFAGEGFSRSKLMACHSAEVILFNHEWTRINTNREGLFGLCS